MIPIPPFPSAEEDLPELSRVLSPDVDSACGISAQDRCENCVRARGVWEHLDQEIICCRVFRATSRGGNGLAPGARLYPVITKVYPLFRSSYSSRQRHLITVAM